MNELHPELEPFVGNLFAPADLDDHPLQEDVGMRVRYLKPTCAVEYDTFTIGFLQRDYRGDVCYRLFQDNDSIGRVCQPTKIEGVFDE